MILPLSKKKTLVIPRCLFIVHTKRKYERLNTKLLTMVTSREWDYRKSKEGMGLFIFYTSLSPKNFFNDSVLQL